MELLETLMEFLKLQSNKTLKEAAEKSDKWWIGMWWKLVLLFGVLIFDAELKMHGYNHAVSYAMFVIPLFMILVFGNPTRQVQFALIWALFVHKDKGTPFKEKVGDGFKEYWTIVGVVLLWSVFIPLGIKLIPIQYCPAAFWTFLPVIAAHELMYWQEWHDKLGREFQRYSIMALKVVIYVCLLLPFFWAGVAMMYERYGYAMPTPSTSTAVINQSVHENEDLLEAKRTVCISEIKEHTLGSGKPLTKSDLAAMEACKTKYPSVALPQKEGASGADKPSWFGIAVLGIGGLGLLHIIGALLIAAGLGFAGYKLVKKSDDAGTTTKTVVVEKKTASSFNLTKTLFWIGLIYALLSWYNGSWITNSADVDHLLTKITAKSAPEQVKYPNAFLTPEEVDTWQAVGTAPDYHRNFGEIAGRSFDLVTAAHDGRRPNLYDRLEAGYGKPLIIKLDERNPDRDVVLENTICNPPKIYNDNKVHTVCVGKWRSGDRKVSGDSELDYSKERRVAVLHSNAGGDDIIFTFQPK